MTNTTYLLGCLYAVAIRVPRRARVAAPRGRLGTHVGQGRRARRLAGVRGGGGAVVHAGGLLHLPHHGGGLLGMVLPREATKAMDTFAVRMTFKQRSPRIIACITPASGTALPPSYIIPLFHIIASSALHVQLHIISSCGPTA